MGTVLNEGKYCVGAYQCEYKSQRIAELEAENETLKQDVEEAWMVCERCGREHDVTPRKRIAELEARAEKAEDALKRLHEKMTKRYCDFCDHLNQHPGDAHSQVSRGETRMFMDLLMTERTSIGAFTALPLTAFSQTKEGMQADTDKACPYPNCYAPEIECHAGHMVLARCPHWQNRAALSQTKEGEG